MAMMPGTAKRGEFVALSERHPAGARSQRHSSGFAARGGVVAEVNPKARFNAT